MSIQMNPAHLKALSLGKQHGRLGSIPAALDRYPTPGRCLRSHRHQPQALQLPLLPERLGPTCCCSQRTALFGLWLQAFYMLGHELHSMRLESHSKRHFLSSETRPFRRDSSSFSCVPLSGPCRASALSPFCVPLRGLCVWQKKHLTKLWM